MHINWTDSSVQSALIQAIGAVIAVMGTFVIGKQFANRRKLQAKLCLAQQDILFLLAVEEAHTEIHVGNTGSSHKNRVRELARKRGHVWSGKFTPGRAASSPTLQACSLN